jgi:hypothetical protein
MGGIFKAAPYRCGFFTKECLTLNYTMRYCIVKSYEQIINLIWIFMGVGICLYSVWLKLWIVSKPGSGLIPFLAGSIICLFGIVRLVTNRNNKIINQNNSKFWENQESRNRVLLCIFGFVAMAFLLTGLGFLPAAIIVTTFLIYVIKPQKMIRVIAISLISCFLTYLLFVIILRVNLPKSPFL